MATGPGEGGQPGDAAAALARDGALAGQWALDPQASRVEFAVRHFWHTITVRGWFEEVSGGGTVGPDGKVTGELVIDARSISTKNSQRDKHLRSADFFDVEKHPQAVLTVREAALNSSGQLAADGSLTAAGITEPVSFTADIIEAGPDAVTLRAALTVDRGRFGMTWSPLKVASMEATGSVTARFTRSG